MGTPRWEGDTRGTGIADGSPESAAVRALLAALAEPGWVAEDPDDHLLPPLRRACAAPGSPWTLERAELRPDGVYAVDALLFPMPALYDVTLSLSTGAAERPSVTVHVCVEASSG